MKKPDKILAALGGGTVGIITLLVCLSVFTQNKILNSAEKFLGLMQSGNYSEAHEITADGFKEATTIEDLSSAFENIEQINVEEFDFELVDVYTYEDGVKEATVEASATSSDGWPHVYSIYLVKYEESTQWEVLGIFLNEEDFGQEGSGPQIEYDWELNPELPEKAVIEEVVKANIDVIIGSLASGDFVPFHNLFADSIKRITPLKDVEDAFKSFADTNEGAKNLAAFELTVNDDSYIHEEGILVSTGQLTGGSEVYRFEIQFVSIDGQWWLSYVYFYPPESL